MGTPVYTTREVVKAALDNRGGSSTDTQIDRLIATASRAIERRMHRQFWPWHGTRVFEWPSRFQLESWALELGRDELIELEALTSAGQTIAVDEAFLEPANAGPPYTRLELNRGTAASFNSGDTNQRTISVTGVFGYNLDEESLAWTLGTTEAAATTMVVTSAVGIGTGSLLRVGTERMIVTRMGLADIGLTLAGALTDRANDTQLTISGTTQAPSAGETIVVDGERMAVLDRVGTTVWVRRGVDGTPISAHEIGATIYAPRSLTVERGACGTTAAPHATNSPVWRFVVLAPIETLCVEETIAMLMQEGAGMARTVGTAEGVRETTNRGLDDARKLADRYRRRNRNKAV